MGCVAAVECYSVLLGDYSTELTNNLKLVVKLGNKCRKRQMTGLPCCHALVVIDKANLWVYNFVHPMYKANTQRCIDNQLINLMETHDVVTINDRTDRIVGGKSWMTCISIASYPRVMDSNLDDRRQSTGSPKSRVRKHIGVPIL